MLSGSIGNLAGFLEQEIPSGLTFEVSDMWKLVEIMRGWEAQALVLEGSETPDDPPPKFAFQPVLIGGRDVENAAENAPTNPNGNPETERNQ